MRNPSFFFLSNLGMHNILILIPCRFQFIWNTIFYIVSNNLNFIYISFKTLHKWSLDITEGNMATSFERQFLMKGTQIQIMETSSFFSSCGQVKNYANPVYR